MNLLVTAGPTREPLDAVRFISNRSSGRMGYACARAGQARGWAVRLVSGPVALPPPAGVDVVPVTTADDMAHAVESAFAWCDALVMAAAVADWTPVETAAGKLKKEGRTALTITCRRTVDILGNLAARKGPRIVVGFAAEAGDPAAEAERKRLAKGADLVVGNNILAPGEGFESDMNRAVLASADAPPEYLPRMTKDRLAALILDRILALRAAAGT